MRKLWLVVGVVLAVGAVGCRKRVPQVWVPNTPEGNTCKRECMQVRASCDSSGIRRDRKETCPQRELACLSTCPGAVVDGDDRQESSAPMQVSAETTAPPQPSPGASCVASELPEWQGASAAEKKALLEKCRAPAPSP